MIEKRVLERRNPRVGILFHGVPHNLPFGMMQHCAMRGQMRSKVSSTAVRSLNEDGPWLSRERDRKVLAARGAQVLLDDAVISKLKCRRQIWHSSRE